MGILDAISGQPAQPSVLGGLDPQMLASLQAGRQQIMADTTPPPASAPPQAPVYAPRNHIGDVLDSLFTDGAFRKSSEREYARQAANYQIANMQRFAQTLPPDEQRKFLADPQGYMANQNAIGLEQAKPIVATAEQRVAIPAGAHAGIVSPEPGKIQVDQASGRPYNDATGAAGPSLGGAYDANGLSTRTGVQVPVITPQKIGPAETLGYTAPPIGGAPAASAAPPMSFPPPGVVKSMLPGVTITSGLRSPAHNAAVGGVPNSYHLDGQAYDLIPAPGQSMEQLAAAVQKQFPGLKVLNEGTHVHIQPMAANRPAVPSELHGKTVAPPVFNPATNQFEQIGPDGKVAAVGSPPFSPEKLRDTVLQHEDYKQASASLAAYNAMKANADTMTGPSAYSMLDTFARAINPGAVARSGTIDAIKESLGPFNKLGGTLDSLQSMGNLTPKVKQQLLDSVYGFVKAHHSQAAALNKANVDIAQRLKMDPRNVTAPLEPMPEPYRIGSERASQGAPPPQRDQIVVANGRKFKFMGGDPHKQTSWQEIR